MTSEKDIYISGILGYLDSADFSKIFSEADMQVVIYEALTANGFSVRREHRLGSRQRIDFMVGSIGIECKFRKSSSTTDCIRQVDGYLAFDEVEALILVTTQMSHRSLPTHAWKKPVEVFWIPVF